jgi:hypothetical protein
MWTITPTDQFERDSRHYTKKRPRELGAVLNNLKRYHELLGAAKNSKSVQAGFLHAEQAGVVAVDQKGGGVGLQETRLYTYAEDDKQILWMITLGNKSSQPDDVNFSREFVERLRSSHM